MILLFEEEMFKAFKNFLKYYFKLLQNYTNKKENITWKLCIEDETNRQMIKD